MMELRYYDGTLVAEAADLESACRLLATRDDLRDVGQTINVMNRNGQIFARLENSQVSIWDTRKSDWVRWTARRAAAPVIVEEVGL